jgi:hypothetical protein
VKLFTLKSGMRQGYTLLFSAELEFLTETIRERNKKGTNRKERSQIIRICR